jgi:hypothetical protein
VPLLGFKSRFVPAVENGVAKATRKPEPHAGVPAKRHTIRALRRDGRDPQPGDLLHLYTGLRTRHVRRLGVVRCRKVESVYVDGRGEVFKIQGRALDAARLRRLAKSDGFENTDELITFLERLHGLPFDGWLIRW